MKKVLVKTRSTLKPRPRPRKSRTRDVSLGVSKIDAASLASSIQLQEDNRDFLYSLIALAMKIGLLGLAAASLLKLGVASHQRVLRHAEIKSELNIESLQLVSLQKRFDHLFTIGGKKRLIDEQEQWIAPNRVRVIWR